jgi:hypothetical protein
MSLIQQRTEQVDYDAYPGDRIDIKTLGVFIVRKTSRTGILFYGRSGWMSYFWLKLLEAKYIQSEQ